MTEIGGLMEKLYNTHVVNLLRIGKSSHNISSFLNNDSMKIDVFFMLDYFNLLLHKRLDAKDKKYTKFLGLEENFTEVRNDSVSDKLLSLYCVAKNEDNYSDVFNCSETEADSPDLSDTPFLGLIQIMINPEYYEHCGYVSGTDFVDKFLLDCETIIREKVDHKFENSKDQYDMFRVLTSGNFYLVMRATNMENIYLVSYIIDMIAYQHEGGSKQAFNMFSTYTNIGIEFGKNSQGNYKTFSENTVYRCKDDQFALRLTCCNGFQTEMIESAENYGIKGVFGKYDFLLRISMEDFAAVYPYLCQHVTGNPKLSDTRKEMQLSNYADVKELLIQGLECGCFKIINERALIYLNKDSYERSICYSEFPKDDKNIIHELLLNCRLLEKMELCFTCGRRSFLDGVRAMHEMVMMYSSLRFETDTYINWQMLCRYLKIVNNTVKAYMNDLLKHSEDTNYQQHFVRDLKTCANAINQYMKFLQSINQQTVQAPQYEIQTRVDSEMLIVAYMEYMNQFLLKYHDYYEKNDPRPRIYPIIYPDIACSGVEVEIPFNKYIQGGKNGKHSNEQLIICRIPSFEYFGRFYNLLPLITHEMSHYIRILPRKLRNEHLLTMIFNAVSLHIVHMWLSQNDKESITYRYGLLKKELADRLSQELKNYFFKLNDTMGQFYLPEEFRIDELSETVIEFFNRFYDHKDELIETEVNLQVSFQGKMKYLANNIMNLLYRYNLAEESNINYVQELLSYDSAQMETIKSQEKADIIKASFQKLIEGIAKEVYRVYDSLTEKYKEKCPDMNRFEYNDFIEEINIFNFRLQKLYLSQERGLAKPINKNGKIYMAILKDYCEELKKLNYICFSFHKLMINVSTEKEMPKLRLCMIEEMDNHLKEVIETYYDKRNFRYILLDSRLNHLLITTGLSLDKKEAQNKKEADNYKKEDTGIEEDLLYQSLQETMKRIGLKDIRCWVNSIINLYRETSADIIMCKTIGFSPFGYFKLMFLTISDSMNDAVDYNPESINIKRVRLVLAVLLKACGHSGMTLKYDNDDIMFDAESLCKAANTYCQSMLRDIKPFVMEELSSNRIYHSFTEEYTRYINQYFDYAVKLVDKIFGRIIVTPWSAVADAFNENFSIKALFTDDSLVMRARLMDHLLRKYDYVFTRIKIFYEGLSNVMIKGAIKVDKIMFSHMLEAYHKCTFINQNNYSNQQIPIEEMRLFYNSINPSPKNFSSDEKLEHMIKFVENYYYLNRLEFMNSQDIE